MDRAITTDLGITGTSGFMVGTGLVPGALDLHGRNELLERARNGK